MFEDRALKEVITLKPGYQLQEPAPTQSGRCSCKKRKFAHTQGHLRYAHTEDRPHEEGESRQPPHSQGERPREKPDLPTPRILSIQNCEAVHFCHLSPSLWQP